MVGAAGTLMTSLESSLTSRSSQDANGTFSRFRSVCTSLMECWNSIVCPRQFSLPTRAIEEKTLYILVFRHVCFVLVRPYRMAQPKRARRLHRNSHTAEDSYQPHCTPPEKDCDLTLNDHKMA